MDDPVLFEELSCRDGRRLGMATLNRPDTLNGLSLPMCDMLHARLQTWARDPAVAAVILKGAGERAFCAGGDLHALYRSMLESPAADPWANTLARRFFETEYRLDFSIHTYPKPILCWGSGIIMGGGVGLMMGASHRIVTGTTRFAMPEVTIGLYPDVAGTWMLSRLPKGIGLFLAMTGAQLGAADCLHYGLADHVCPPTALPDVVEELAAVAWADDPAGHYGQIDAVLANWRDPKPLNEYGPLQRHALAIRRACGSDDFLRVCRAIGAWSNHEDPWLDRAARTFKKGSPGSARLSFTLLRRARLQSLADVFREEYIASLHCCAQPDLREGIRALLIDKDKQPHWQPATPEQADSRWVQRFLQAPWPAAQAHPLADLGAD